MCHHPQHKGNKNFVSEKKYRLATFFIMWWNIYCKSPKEFIRPEVYKAANAIMVCRTEVLGVDYYVCPECGEITKVYHNCKNRSCPTCSWIDTIKWAEILKTRIFNIPHRHCVFTLPHSLNGLIKYNKEEMLNILSRVSADIFKSWFKARHNIKIGIVTVIHTYGEKKNAHYHTHKLVSWGGMNFDTGDLIELTGKEKEYINYEHLKKEFRRKYINELEKLYNEKELNHNFKTKTEFKRFIKKLHKHKWQIHLEPPMDTPEEIIRYIARYSKRSCLSEYKITNIEGEFITFKYKDYANRIDPKDPKSPAKIEYLKLHYYDFFPLLLQHVPPPNFRMVRYYGAYARFGNIPEEYKAPIKEEEKLSETIAEEWETNEDNPKYCSGCNVGKVYVDTLFDKRPKSERTEPFDITKHKHIFRKRLSIVEEKCLLKHIEEEFFNKISSDYVYQFWNRRA